MPTKPSKWKKKYVLDPDTIVIVHPEAWLRLWLRRAGQIKGYASADQIKRYIAELRAIEQRKKGD